jgi:hypothetical protein
VPRYWRLENRELAKTGVAYPFTGHRIGCSILERVAMRTNREGTNRKTKDMAVYMQTKAQEGRPSAAL